MRLSFGAAVCLLQLDILFLGIRLLFVAAFLFCAAVYEPLSRKDRGADLTSRGGFTFYSPLHRARRF